MTVTPSKISLYITQKIVTQPMVIIVIFNPRHLDKEILEENPWIGQTQMNLLKHDIRAHPF